MVKKNEGKLIVYKSYTGVLVCRPESEKRMIREWFKEGGWDLNECERTVSRGVITIDHRIRVSEEHLLEKE